MKYLHQLLIIMIFTFAGEVLHYLVPVQIPASIYGLILLFVALMAGWIKLDQIRETAKFLIEIMPLMFVPAGVGLLENWSALAPIVVSVLIITVISTILVFGASGIVTQKIIQGGKRS